MRARRPLLALIALAALLTGGYVTSALRSPDAGPGPARPVATASDGALPVVPLSSLPTEVDHTIALIRQGGPFPYSRDGVVFANREHLLPAHPSGYYHEYTVPTPGENDRGPRRVVAGGEDEFYYTADHYVSFVAVDPDR